MKPAGGSTKAAANRRPPTEAAALGAAEEDIIAFYASPAEHSPKLRTTDPLERFNREIGRRSNVVGIFPP
jgi:putative transposase